MCSKFESPDKRHPLPVPLHCTRALPMMVLSHSRPQPQTTLLLLPYSLSCPLRYHTCGTWIQRRSDEDLLLLASDYHHAFVAVFSLCLFFDLAVDARRDILGLLCIAFDAVPKHVGTCDISAVIWPLSLNVSLVISNCLLLIDKSGVVS